jgi:predicted transposase/invertase (TIGR01784 family)
MLLSKFLDPKNDIAFKRIFGSERNKDILIHFLNDMLIFKERQPIVEVTFLKTIQDPEIASKKQSIVDILCKDEAGHTYVVEMQVAKSKGFEKRAQYYAAKAYISQMDKGDTKYYNLKEVIFLAIVDYVMFPDKKAYKSDHVILDKTSCEHDLKDFSFTFLELGKFNKDKDDLKTMIEKWSYYFKHADETSERELQEIFEQDVIIRKAYEELNRFSWNEEELRAYDQEIKRERDNEAVMDEKLYQAEIKGMERGMEKGMEKGKQEGKLEGIQEVAFNFLNLGFPIEKVSEATGLSISALEELKKLANMIS